MRKEIRQRQAPINVGHLSAVWTRQAGKTRRYEVAAHYPQHEEMKA